MPEYIKCDYCGEELHKSEITYVEGRPYCEDCVSEAEIYLDAEPFDEDENDEYIDYIDD